MNLSEIRKYHEKITPSMRKCSCGHSIYISNNMDKKICTWCGKYVFRDKKEEFIYRLRETERGRK